MTHDDGEKLRRTAVHTRAAGQGCDPPYDARKRRTRSHAAEPPLKALNHERPRSSARQHGVLSGGRIVHLLPADRSLEAGGRLGLRHRRKVDRVFAEGERPHALGKR